MQQTLQNGYLALLRLQGGLVLGFLILLVIGSFSSDLPGLRHPMPILAGLCTFVTAVMFIVPNRLPRLLSHPSGMLSALAVAALHLIAPFVFMVPVMTSVVAFEIAEPASRYMAVGASGAVFLASAALWWFGLILAIWRRFDPERATAEPWSHDGFDFRARP